MLRFAVSPTQDLDLNQLRVALLNHIVAKQKSESLIIRIEDLDKDKVIEKKDKDILNILNLFSIDYTQVLHQSSNVKYHQQIAMQFLVEKKAFNCFCSDEALKKDGTSYYSGFCENLHDENTLNLDAPFTVRLKKPQENVSFEDKVYKMQEFTPNEVDSYIILNHAKMPSPTFANGIDDMLSNISTVIRSDNNLNNSAKQIHTRDQIGYDQKIEYAHIPTLKKGDISVQSLIDEGYLPVAIANYLITLGSNTPKEIFTIEEAIEWFDISKLSLDSVLFDMEKLKQFNQSYIKDLDNMRLSKILGFADEDIGQLAKLYANNLCTINEIKEKISKIFAPKQSNENNKIINQCLANAPYIDSFEEFKNYIIKNTTLQGENLDKAIYYSLTGEDDGIDIELIYPLIKNYLGEIIC